MNSIDISEQTNYDSAVFEILKNLLPEINFQNLLVNYIEQSEREKNLTENSFLNTDENAELDNRNGENHMKIHQLQHIKLYWIFSIFCVCLFFLGVHLFKGSKKMQVTEINENIIKPFIRSDLIIPTEAVLLHRPEVILHINEKLKGQNGIQSLALIGPGGAGKTTLARQYTHQEKAQVIWEVNAESYEGLKDSFERLAQALAQTEEDKKSLKGFLNISNLIEREEKIISFVKERLKACSSWTLIFDNMEKFSDLQKHFPQDAETWGNGKVILTTRDSTIQNNKHIRGTLQVGELTPLQMLTLFTKIMTNGDENSFSLGKKEETQQFLMKIPPYPLDVSVAAYYLKTTNASFDGYIENINQNNKDFANIQANFLKEAGGYTQTRYGILTISLQHLMNTDKNFIDLLFFISLLNSQNIPRELLDKYKHNLIVDNFIFNLKKYSLITNESSLPFLGQTISLHRSTQNISLAYLLKILPEEKKEKFLQLAISTLDSYIDEIIYKENLEKMELLIAHLKAFLNHGNLLDNKMQGEIRSRLGYIYYHLRDYINGKKALEEALEILKETHLNNPIKIVDILMYLAIINMELGNYEKAKALIAESLRDYSSYFAETNMSVAKTFLNIGDVYGVIGECGKAKNMLEKSLLIYDQSLLKHQNDEEKSLMQSPIRGRTLALLGNVYGSLGEYEKARDFLEESLKTYEAFFPGHYFDITAASVLLGNVYINIGAYERGVNLIERSIASYKKILPEDHLDLAWASLYLGNAYEKFQNFTQAQKVLEKTLEIHKKALGESNIRSAWTSLYLGRVYVKLGKILEGRTLLNQALLIYEKNYGKNHIETGRVLEGLGQAYLAEGNFDSSETYLNKAFKIFQKSDHTDIYMILEDLAQLYIEKSKLAETQGNKKLSKDDVNQAISFLAQAAEIVKARFPKHSSHLTRIQEKLKDLK